MIVNVVMLLVLVLSIVQFAVLLRSIESEQKEMLRMTAQLEEQHKEQKTSVEHFTQLAEASGKILGDALKEVESLRNVRDLADAELKAAEAQPKERLFVVDKNTIIHSKLWELTITNTTLGEMVRPPPTMKEWMAGRIVLFGAATERDARNRAELKYPSTQGFKITQAKRFRRN